MTTMAGISDTSVEADRVLTQVYRRLSPGQKWLRLGSAFAEGRMLHAVGFRHRHPDATLADIQRDWLGSRLGLKSIPTNQEWDMDQHLASIRDTRVVIRVLDQLSIAYLLGGSVASSIHGIDRYTRDADLAVEPFPGKEAQLAGSFGADFYLSLPAIEEAVRNRSSFNIINTSSGFKIDVPIVSIEREAFSDAFIKSKPIASKKSELPDFPEEDLLPCFAILHPAADATILDAVLILKVFILSPPVPQLSIKLPLIFGVILIALS